MPSPTERIVLQWVRELDQAKLDAWMTGKISVGQPVSELLTEHRLLAKSSKWALLRWMDGLTSEGILRWIREQRPDLRFADEAEVLSRISTDLREVRRQIEGL